MDGEPDVLATLEEEILAAAPKCKFEKATTYQEAAKKLESQNYDVVILDIMGVRGFDLLELAVSRNFRVAMLTAHALTPEALKRSFEMKARAYLPKEKMNKLEGYFESRWGQDWQKTEAKFWKDFEKKPHI